MVRAVASNYERAQAVIRGMGSRFDRAAVVRWGAIRDRTSGPERQRIAQMAEALYPLAESELDRRWLGMFLSGIPAAVQEAMADAPAASSRR